MIDLSMLTPIEAEQLKNDPVLVEGDIDVCLYMRYSSDKQTDQSIEGQLRDLRAYCTKQGYRIRAIYVDRATTATSTDKRTSFLRMISDSDKKHWQYVVVWKLDRFARNRTDSAIYKYRLRKNGVRVLSCTEAITDSPEGIILEAVLEGMAEFYSADLSQKITRGLRESALKCHSVGGYVPLGYKLKDHKLVINPDTAPIVQEAFQRYADGESVASICRSFNELGYKTAKGADFNRNSFKAMFKNERYIGVYLYKDIRIDGGVPPIIDRELFDKVGKKLKETAKAPARAKGKENYLLSGKLFCGHCGSVMNGESGTGRHGGRHYYYSCRRHKMKRDCDKRPVKRAWIEDIVVKEAMSLLTDDMIEEIADLAIKQADEDIANRTRLPMLLNRQKEVIDGISNLTRALEQGVVLESVIRRIKELETELTAINREIEDEQKCVAILDRYQVIYWLLKFRDGDIQDEKYRRTVVDLFIDRVYVYDEPDGYRLTLIFNLTSQDPKEIKGFDFGMLGCTKQKTDTVKYPFFVFCNDAGARTARAAFSWPCGPIRLARKGLSAVKGSGEAFDRTRRKRSCRARSTFLFAFDGVEWYYHK